MNNLIEIFVDDKSYDTEDGFTIFTYSSYKAGIIVEEAIKLLMPKSCVPCERICSRTQLLAGYHIG